jgi:hypothetical protein
VKKSGRTQDEKFVCNGLASLLGMVFLARYFELLILLLKHVFLGRNILALNYV